MDYRKYNITRWHDSLWIDNGIVDQTITKTFYVATNAIGDQFPVGNEEPWAFFNAYNSYFEYILLGIFAFLLLLGLVKRQRFGFMIRYAVFGIIAYLINTAVIVNLIFKGLWGRPRPGMTNLFPNTTNPIGPFFMVWVPAFVIDPSLIGLGVSFPSGNVANIVSYIMLFYIFMEPTVWSQDARKREKKWFLPCG